MQRAVHDVNKKEMNETKKVIFSQDVKALYPSLSIEDVKELVVASIMETEVEFLNVDIKMVGKYLAVNLTKDEQSKQNIISCLPDRVTELEETGRERVNVAYLDNDYIRRKNDNGVMEKIEKWSWRGKMEPRWKTLPAANGRSYWTQID
jgi:hypothetical protein